MHDVGLEKFSKENAERVGNQMGRFIETDEGVENIHKTVMRLKVEVNVKEPLLAGFWWKNSQGDEK